MVYKYPLTSLILHIWVQVKTCSAGGNTLPFFLSADMNVLSCWGNKTLGSVRVIFKPTASSTTFHYLCYCYKYKIYDF